MVGIIAVNPSVSAAPREWQTPVMERAAALGAKHGISFSVSRDFEELVAINERNRRNWDALVPQFHPTYSADLPENGFWVKGVDRAGAIVTVRAVRRFTLAARRTLHDALTDLSFFYADRVKALPGERVESLALLPRAVTGSFSFGGATWTHPEARRLGLATLISPIVRAVAQDLWGLPLHIAFVEDMVTMRGILGFENMESGICWMGSYVAPVIRFSVAWWRREQMIEDLVRFVDEGVSVRR
jgi:hypothetical protein